MTASAGDELAHPPAAQSPPPAVRFFSAQVGSHGGMVGGVPLSVLSLPLSAAAGAPGASPPAGRAWPVGVLTVAGAASEPSGAASAACSGSGSGAASARSQASHGGATRAGAGSPGVAGTERNLTGNYGYCSPASSADSAPLHSQERSRCSLSMGSCRSDAASAPGPGGLSVSMLQYDQSTLGHTGRVSGSSPPFDASSSTGVRLLAGQGHGPGWSAGTGSSIGELSTTPSSIARLSSRGLAASGFISSSGADGSSGGSSASNAGDANGASAGFSGRFARLAGAGGGSGGPATALAPLVLPTLLVDRDGRTTGTAAAGAGMRAAGSLPADHAAVASELSDRDREHQDALLTGRVTARSFEQVASPSPASLASPSYTLSASAAHAAPLPSAR